MIQHLLSSAVLAFALSYSSFAQNKLHVYDLSRTQLRLMKNYEATDTNKRSKVFLDSIYKPYASIWDGYMGNGEEVVKWTNDHLPTLSEMQSKSKVINTAQLVSDLSEVALEMERLTGFKAQGNWYIFYGAAWTDLGSLGDDAMIIDLSHSSNSSQERIKRMLPHELTHQIMSRTNAQKDTTAISSIVGEGFSVWMSMKYWGDRYPLSDLLGYTDRELELCDINVASLKNLYTKFRYSSDPDIINLFRNRDVKLNENVPGAIGYYIGFRIVEAYVERFGKDSYKDVFTKPAKEIAELSGF